MIGFWLKQSGNYMSSGNGLTEEQVRFLHSLRPGDRLLLWNNDREGAPDMTLAKYKPINQE